MRILERPAAMVLLGLIFATLFLVSASEAANPAIDVRAPASAPDAPALVIDI